MYLCHYMLCPHLASQSPTKVLFHLASLLPTQTSLWLLHFSLNLGRLLGICPRAFALAICLPGTLLPQISSRLTPTTHSGLCLKVPLRRLSCTVQFKTANIPTFPIPLPVLIFLSRTFQHHTHTHSVGLLSAASPGLLTAGT